jgi:hypothetical protein
MFDEEMTFVADHPFLFHLISHNSYNQHLPLFIGKFKIAAAVAPKDEL